MNPEISTPGGPPDWADSPDIAEARNRYIQPFIEAYEEYANKLDMAGMDALNEPRD